jgi:hypothetical protein
LDVVFRLRSPDRLRWSYLRPRLSDQRSQRRLSGRESASVEDAQPITPGSNHPVPMYRPRGVGEGSPLAATPPITVNTTGKDESALEGDDSMVARDYVVIEKRTVEVNALADGSLSSVFELGWWLVAETLDPFLTSQRAIVAPHSYHPPER